MIKNWSKTILTLVILPIIVAIVAVLSTTPALVIAVIFPLILLAFLLNFTPKPLIKVDFASENDVAYVGDEISFKATVRIEQGLGLVFLRLPAINTFELVSEETNVHLLFKGLRKIQEREYIYKMKALRRGLFRFPNVSYSYYTPLSFSSGEHGSVPSKYAIKILPKIQLIKRSQVNFRSLFEIPRSSRARLGPYSTDFVKIRDYSVGDPYKFINWKASSRLTSDKLLINEYDREGLRTFLFVLDRGLSMRRGTVEENPLEYGIAFVLSYSRILLNQGINVGLWLEPRQIGDHSSTRLEDHVLPSSGTEHYQRIKELLISTEASSGPKYDSANQYQTDSRSSARSLLLPRIIRESLPSIVFVTNFEKSNDVSIYNYVRWLQRAGASSVTILDIIPYNFITKYSSSTISPSENVLGSFLKSVLVSTKKKEQYSILGKTARVIPWDPATESLGKAVRMSIALAGRGPSNISRGRRG